MYSKMTPNRQHLTAFRHHETKAFHAHAVPYRSHDEDTTALFLALTGVALMVVTVVSTLVAFRVL